MVDYLSPKSFVVGTRFCASAVSVVDQPDAQKGVPTIVSARPVDWGVG